MVFYVIMGYLIAGILFSIYFLIRGIAKIDVATTDSGWKFKLIILPGCILLWPVLLTKLYKK